MKQWQNQQTQLVFTNHWLKVWIDTLIDFTGESSQYTYASRPVAGVVIVPFFTTSQTILLTAQYRHPLGRIIWQLPGGTRDTSETIRQTARRELREETGYRAARLISLGKFFPDAGILSQSGRFFLALDPQSTESFSIGHSEILKIKHYTVDQIKDMIRNGVIRDGWTVSAFSIFLFWREHDHSTNLS